MFVLALGLHAVSIASCVPSATPTAIVRGLETRAEELAKLRQSYDEALEAWKSKVNAVKDEAQRAPLYASLPRDEFVPLFKSFVTASPKDEQAFEALDWLAKNAQAADKAWTLDQLEAHHLERVGLERAVAGLGADRAPRTKAFLETLLAKGGTEIARAHACFTLAQQSQGYGAAARRFASFTTEEREGWRKSVGEEFVAFIQTRSAEEFEAEAEKYFDRCVREFGEIELRGEPMAKRAEGYLFELRHLSIGKLAPEIEGRDLSGVEFKLSDYRGKVVVLDFWGHW